MPSYKSYCWSLGTTSFRMVEFNKKIEQQLQLLQEFWALPNASGKQWSNNEELQSAYYDFLLEKQFIEGNAPRKAKDARQKTSGLKDLGLVDSERKITATGLKLLQIASAAQFDKNNILQIPADSYLYFLQLMKYTDVENNIRPYIILAMALNRWGVLTNDEFTYLLPLAIDDTKAAFILDSIGQIRSGRMSIEQVILGVLLQMDNYKEALKLFLENDVSEQLIQDIGMNRKSRSYDKPYFALYQALSNLRCTRTSTNVKSLLTACKKISGKPATIWKQYLFNTPSTAKIEADGISAVNTNVSLLNCNDEIEFKTEFFKLLHLFKAKSLLEDYHDLNRRYFKTTDTVLFRDNTVMFDIIPKCFFAIVDEKLSDIAFVRSTNLQDNVALDDIVGTTVSDQAIFEKVEELYGITVRNLYDVQNFVEDERYRRFNQLVDDRFTDENLISLMTMFEERRDAEIQSLVTNNADVPTIFEYVLAIAWYKISNRQGKVLDYMNLSLDADLLPITHAAGGHEDITYQYNATEAYPAHTLLIEATLANSTNQRRMEMEPVSRHLGTYLIKHDANAYLNETEFMFHMGMLDEKIILLRVIT